MVDPQLEADYDVLAGIGATMPEIVADWIAASRAAVADANPAPLSISYGDDDGLTYDVFLPQGKPRGAVLFLHGGFWVQGNKDSVLFPQSTFTAAGLSYVAVTYGLAPRYTLDGLVTNVEAAARSFAERAPQWEIDTGRIALIGHSAGGYLAAALACSDRRAFTPLGSLLVSGLFDLRRIHALARIEALALGAADAARLSIGGGDLVGKGEITLAVGGTEPAGFQRQTADLARALADAGVPPRIVAMPGCDHFSIARELGRPESTLAAQVIRLFE
jgi:arylformamidase